MIRGTYNTCAWLYKCVDFNCLVHPLPSLDDFSVNTKLTHSTVVPIVHFRTGSWSVLGMEVVSLRNMPQ